MGRPLSASVTGYVIFRYVPPAVIGVSLFTALLCRRTLNGRPSAVLLLATWVVLMAGLNVIEHKGRLLELSGFSGKGLAGSN